MLLLFSVPLSPSDFSKPGKRGHYQRTFNENDFNDSRNGRGHLECNEIYILTRPTFSSELKLLVTKYISGVIGKERLKVVVNLPPIFSFDKAVNPLQLEQLPNLVRTHLQKWL